MSSSRDKNDVRLDNTETTTLTTSDSNQLESRNRLWKLFRECDMSDAELERSMGLFLRSSLLARILAFNEIYQTIIDIPGQVFDFGTWRGQNAVLSENLRAIYEPFNKQRRIICFDTFEGYANWSAQDRKSTNYQENTYSTGKNYAGYLKQLLETHEGCNALGHITGRHEIVAGDATQTVPSYLQKNPNTLVALAYFDLGLYEPTKIVLQNIRRHLVPGSVLCFLQLTRDELVGDAVAFLEQLRGVEYRIAKSKIYPSFNTVKILKVAE